MVIKKPCIAWLFWYGNTALFAEVHAALFVQLAEIGITQILNETDGFTGRFHFRSQIFIDTGEFVEAEYGLFNGITLQTLHKLLILQPQLTQHYFSSHIQIRDLIGFGDEWRSTGSTWVGFDHIHFTIFNGKLNIDQPSDI